MMRKRAGDRLPQRQSLAGGIRPGRPVPAAGLSGKKPRRRNDV